MTLAPVRPDNTATMRRHREQYVKGLQMGEKNRARAAEASPGSQATPSAAVASSPIGADPSRGFAIKRWCVAVRDRGTGYYECSSRGKAIAQAWRCDAFGHLGFGEFLKIAHCWRDRDLPPRWGDPITVGGRPAYFVENNRQYVRFAYPGSGHVSNAHPYDVLPVEYRPDTYRDRDSDRNPTGGDGTAPSRSDESASRNGIAQPPSQTQSEEPTDERD